MSLRAQAAPSAALACSCVETFLPLLLIPEHHFSVLAKVLNATAGSINIALFTVETWLSVPLILNVAGNVATTINIVLSKHALVVFMTVKRKQIKNYEFMFSL